MTLSGRTLVRNGLLNLVGQVVPLLVGVATVPFIVRGLGAERFGLLSLAWVLLSYSAVLDLGLGRASAKFVAEARAKAQGQKVGRIVAGAVLTQGALGSVVGFTFTLLAPVLLGASLKMSSGVVGEAAVAFQLLGLAFPLVLIAGSLSGALQGAERFDLVNAVQIPVRISAYLAALLATWLNLGLVGALGLVVLLRGLGVVALFCLLTRHVCKPTLPSLRELTPLFTFGGWISISQIVGPLLLYAERFTLAASVSATAVGYYAAAHEAVGRTVLLFPAAASVVLFPGFAAWTAVEDRAAFSSGFIGGVTYMLLAVGLTSLFLFTFGDVILAVWLGGEYARQASQALRILLVGAVFHALAHVPAAALQAAGRADITAVMHVAQVPLYIAASWLLVGHSQLVGAALAWTGRVILNAFLLFWLCKRIMGVTLLFRGQPRMQRVLRTLCVYAAAVAGARTIAGYLGFGSHWAALLLPALLLPAALWYSVGLRDLRSLVAGS